MSQIPVKALNSNANIPVVGYGTFKATDDEKLSAAIKEAIKNGYRAIDCAWVYRNEAIIGKALKEAMQEFNLKRSDFFITGKIWNTHHSKKLVRKCFDESLNNLQLDYLDLLLCHWPFGYAENTGKEPFPSDDDGKMRFSDVHYLQTYQAMEELVQEGKVKIIGLSNFSIQQVKDVMDNCTIKPSVNQFEINPYCPNFELVEFCQNNGLVVEGYAPLGASDRAWSKTEDPKVLENDVILRLADKHKKTPAQISIKWVLQRNIVVLVKSVTSSRIKENIDVFDFELDESDMQAINNINQNFRYYVIPAAKEHPFYPF